MFIPYKTFAELMLIFEDIDAHNKYWLLSDFCFKPFGQVCLRMLSAVAERVPMVLSAVGEQVSMVL
jgi:hypothetical protein